MTRVRAAVFASGTGSNFEAIMEERQTLCDIVLLVCDKKDAGVLEKAEFYGVDTFVFNPKEYESRKDYETLIVKKLNEKDISWIFLAGYMRIVGEKLLQAFEGNILNIHPSLLPAFPGIDAIGQAYDAGVPLTGVTVHYIDAGVDTGPIIDQESVEILPNDTKATLAKKIHDVEHKLYPRVILDLLKKDE